MTTCDAILSLGAYVLGTLDERERAEVDAHLRECAECREQLAELTTLPPLLARLSLQDLGEAIPVVAVPDALFAKVAAQAEAEASIVVPIKARRRMRFLSAAAALVLLAGGATTAALVHSSGSNGGDIRAGAQGTVQMSVSLTSQSTGTALRVTASGLHPDEHCRLVAVGDDGTRDVVGWWWATDTGEAQVTGSTTLPESAISHLVLYGTNGEDLVTVQV